ncbi:MAG: putative Ig domain-containing protein [Nanoarchaeota archaeon]
MKRKAINIMIFVLVLVLTIFKAGAFPQIAAEIYGSVSVNWTGASVGTNVTAYDHNGTLCGFFIVVNQGYYGSLSCNGDDPRTAADEGAQFGDNISLFVDNKRAVLFGNTSWASGIFMQVNVSAQNYAPTFDHNLTSQVINESDNLIYDVNCSDLNYWDNITYYVNTTFFNISLFTGVINWTTNDAHIGNHSFNVSCSDGQANTTGLLRVTVKNIDYPPVLEPIGNQIAVENQLFLLDIDATDADNNILTYTTNTTLFIINPITGLINFTPTISDVGNYSINISVTDGVFTVSEVISLRIVRGPYCGDSSCGSTEDCSSCPADCGTCIIVPSDSTVIIPGEYGDTIPGPVRVTPAKCSEKWECAEWSECTPDNYRTRKCIDINKCETTSKKPNEIEECIYQGDCFDALQNCHDGSCEEGADCGGPCKACPEEASCFDGIKNCHDDFCEEGIDCGGDCKACEIKKYAKIPVELEKLAPIIKKYPWILLIILSALMILTVSGDKLYVKRITKKEFEEYRKKMNYYRSKRKKLYVVSVTLSTLIFISSFYVYMLQDKRNVMFGYIWGTVALVIAGFILMPVIVSKMKYYEYKKKLKEVKFFKTDKNKKEHLVKIEDMILAKLELQIGKRIFDNIKSDQIEKSLIDMFTQFYELLINLSKKRKEKLVTAEPTAKITCLINELGTDIILGNLAPAYPQFKSALEALSKYGKLKKNVSEHVKAGVVDDIIQSVRDISADNHLMTVIKSDEKSVLLYNELVDVYSYFKDQLDTKQSIQKQLAELEGEFKNKVAEFTNNAPVLEMIKSENNLISLYNSIVDLFNHYKKKEAIYSEIRQMQRHQ